MRSTPRRDSALITAARTLRGLGYGLLSVALGLHLAALGLTPGQVGAVFTATLVGSALLTAVFVALADRFGRRRSLAVSAGLMMASGLLFAVVHRFEALLVVALLGTISPTSGEVGPFETLEQAMLPQTVSIRQRNRAFGWYNSLAALMTGLGALLSGAPGWLGASGEHGFAWAFVVYAGLGLASLLCFVLLSPAVEIPSGAQAARPSALRLEPRSRSIVVKLAALFGLDALAGGFVLQSLIAYWFHLRFGAGAEVLGPLFSATELLKAVSYYFAVRLADRIGLVNTMVFTHLPSNVLLMALPLMPSLSLAMGVLLLRHTMAQMDVPTRQSFVVTVVPPGDRTAANGITNLTRTLTRSVSPSLAGLALQLVGQGLPFFIGGGLKIVYDLLLYASFRHIRSAEEVPAT